MTCYGFPSFRNAYAHSLSNPLPRQPQGASECVGLFLVEQNHDTSGSAEHRQQTEFQADRQNERWSTHHGRCAIGRHCEEYESGDLAHSERYGVNRMSECISEASHYEEAQASRPGGTLRSIMRNKKNV